jgi:hypothetical protein
MTVTSVTSLIANNLNGNIVGNRMVTIGNIAAVGHPDVQQVRETCARDFPRSLIKSILFLVSFQARSRVFNLRVIRPKRGMKF